MFARTESRAFAAASASPARIPARAGLDLRNSGCSADACASRTPNARGADAGVERATTGRRRLHAREADAGQSMDVRGRSAAPPASHFANLASSSTEALTARSHARQTRNVRAAPAVRGSAARSVPPKAVHISGNERMLGAVLRRSDAAPSGPRDGGRGLVRVLQASRDVYVPPAVRASDDEPGGCRGAGRCPSQGAVGGVCGRGRVASPWSFGLRTSMYLATFRHSYCQPSTTSLG